MPTKAFQINRLVVDQNIGSGNLDRANTDPIGVSIKRCLGIIAKLNRQRIKIGIANLP